MFSVHEVNRLMEAKKREKYVVFEKIYDQCQQRIIKYAQNEKYRFFFEVPEFMIGLPVYNLNAAIIYLMEKLKKQGFLVKYFFPKYVYICWDFEEIQGKPPTPARLPIQFTTSQVSQRRMLPAQQIGPPSQNTPSSNHQSGPFLPPPMQTRNVTNNIILPQTPAMDLPMPQSTTYNKGSSNKFIKSIADMKPSGKFSLNI